MSVITATDREKQSPALISRVLEIGVRLSLPRRTSLPVPVTFGVPLPRDVDIDEVPPLGRVVLGDDTVPCQLAPQRDRGWLLATFLCPPGATGESLLLQFAPPELPSETIRIARQATGFAAETGRIAVDVHPAADQLLACGDAKATLNLLAQSGRHRTFLWDAPEITEAGPLRSTILLHGKCGPLRATCQVSLYAGSTFVRCEITVHNPRRARHPGGYWDLGDPGSVLLRGLSLDVTLPKQSLREILWRETLDDAEQQTAGSSLQIYQESSGGEHWRSLNHVNRLGEVPLRFRGYRVRTFDRETSGHRASPLVVVRTDDAQLTCGIEEFWQKFPTAIEVGQGQLRAKLLPEDFPDLHELQAGETCTRVVWLDFGCDGGQGCDRLAWIHQPPAAVVEQGWMCRTAALRFLPNSAAEPRAEVRSLLRQALTGEPGFFAKREAVDEFGWRNFGDMWADHEQAYAEDPQPIVSHYNNQYDLLHGLLVQYVLTGDRRWWELADPLARHVMDIDIYHTTRDKPAYNGGLFWHTAHYHAVGKATHRSMSTTMRGKRIPAPGAGPCNEHNYSDGLLLYQRLTGCSRAGDCALQLADWVIAMDDGERHLLGLLSDQPTGLASCTRDPLFHGPGRGAGNSINVLLNAWQLSGDQKYLDKGIALIRRTIHPADDVAALDLANAELRWSYTVHLQALVRFVEVTAGYGPAAADCDYARSALLHYARWMAQHETFYLDRPEQLEYPTETWAAQELRKGTTLLMAARYTSDDETKMFRARGCAILDRAWEALMAFESRTCTRSLAIVLQQCYLETYLRSNTEIASPSESSGGEVELPPAKFVTQKQVIRESVRRPRSLLSIAARVLNPSRWFRAIGQTWGAERLRRLLESP